MDDDGSKQPSSIGQDSLTSKYDRIVSRNSRNEREIRRLRSSISFQLGVHITKAIRYPWRLPFLIITFPLLIFRLGLQRLGRKPINTIGEINLAKQPNRKHSIVLFPTNGVGFGHFTRMYAVARSLRKKDPALEIIFFTPMPTLHILYSDQFPTYHLAGRYKHADMSASQWNGLVEDMLHMVFEMHRPKWFMFDGAYPYRGMLNAIASQPDMEKWWMRRGSLKKNKTIPVDSQSYFDGIIMPGESNEVEEDGVHVVAPIRAIEPEEAWERSFSRSRLSVPDDGKVVYVQLGAGRINNIEDMVDLVLKALFEHSEVYVVLGESMLGERLTFTHERLRVIRDYPNALYARAFDASVQAGGYNSYQEMRMFGIPTLFIPNTETGMDDQVARCRVAEQEGWGTIFLPGEKSIEDKITELLKMTAIPMPSENGVHSIMDLLDIGSI